MSIPNMANYNNNILRVSEYDINVTKGLNKLIKEYRLNNQILEGLLELKPSTISELLNGRSAWRLKHIARIALYFNVSIDELAFGEKDFVKKTNKAEVLKLKNSIKQYLIDNKKYETLGKMEAINYFDETE